MGRREGASTAEVSAPLSKPSWPEVLSPQVKRRPSESRAREWRSPAAMAATEKPLRVVISWGWSKSPVGRVIQLRPGTPSWPREG